MDGINRKAFLAINRAGTLEQAYMNVSSAIIETFKKVETADKDDQPLVAYHAVAELMAQWQYVDQMLAAQFRKLEMAVAHPHKKSSPEDWEVNQNESS